jgi:hypothetical protein
MDELIQWVAQKTGLPPSNAKEASNNVINFLKTKLPPSLAV